jgi:hypothetical protein
MRINQIIMEASKVGRTFQHLEDLVLIDGVAGAKNAIARLADAARSGPQAVRWKWDGKPTIYWGREPSGQFVMTGTGGWNKRDGSGKSSSAQELANYLMSTGRIEPGKEQERMKFATEFASLWPLFEKSTPADFRGYVYGDLLYFRRPPVTGGTYTFTPNKVSYHVKADSELGQQISQSMAAVVGHAYFPQFGLSTDDQQPIDDFTKFNQNPALIVLGPRYVASTPQVDTKKLQDISKYVDANAAAIEAFLNDEALTAMKMSGFKNVLYAFGNDMSKSGQLTDLANKFIGWLPNSKQSAPMQEKIKAWVAKNQRGFIAAFATVENLRDVKNQIIDQLDREGGDVTQSMDGQIGGEGYVMYSPQGNVKLVPRHRWSPVFDQK